MTETCDTYHTNPSRPITRKDSGGPGSFRCAGFEGWRVRLPWSLEFGISNFVRQAPRLSFRSKEAPPPRRGLGIARQ